MYEPPKEILEKYADVLINFALRDCTGIQKGDVVQLRVPECAKPLLVELYRVVLKAGGHPIIQYAPDDMQRDLYELGTGEQISFFPEKYLKGQIDQIDHMVAIIAETNKHELKGISPEKLMRRQKSFKPYMEWRNEKENNKKFWWTLAMYATPAMAEEANMSLEEYWQEIIKACYLEDKDPVAKWKQVTQEIETIKDKLTNLKIDSLRVEAEGTDITIGLGENRKWLGGSGRNIPSFEIFISPDYRRTEGTIQFTEPLYRYGNLIKDVKLTFKDGKIIESSASEGEEILKEIINTEGADQIGEYSLTDSRHSQITKFMGETLFDENVGGDQGNTHLAIGSAYKDSYTGDPATVTKKEWDKMGYNDSAVHMDIVATSKRKVTATLQDGSTKVIYENGQFTL